MRVSAKRLMILLVLVISTVATFYYIINAEYTIEDINADNYQKKLSSIENISIFRGSNTLFLRHPNVLSNAQNGVSNKLYTFSKYNTQGIDVVEVKDASLHDVWYSVYYHENSSVPYQYNISEPEIENNTGSQLAEIIMQLEEKGNFTRKNSASIDGQDILIKKADGFFLIGVIFRERGTPFGLNFKLFSRKRFFSSLREK